MTKDDLKQEEIPLLFFETEKRIREAKEKILKDMRLNLDTYNFIRNWTAIQFAGDHQDYGGYRFTFTKKNIYFHKPTDVIGETIKVSVHKLE